MELSVLNIKGKETGRKVKLNPSVFGIDPNDHAIYLDVKQHLANKRQGTHKSKERAEIVGSTRKIKNKREQVLPELVVSRVPSFVVEVESLAQPPGTTTRKSTKKSKDWPENLLSVSRQKKSPF